MLRHDIPTIERGKSGEPGWYVGCVLLPDCDFMQPVFWDGEAWAMEKEGWIYKILWVYERRLESEAEAYDFADEVDP